MKRLITLLVFIGLAAVGFLQFNTTDAKPPHAPITVEEQESAAVTAEGVGALGRIEPRSRVIRLSHDAGPDGARVEVLHVEEGQDVKQGDIIVTFSDHGRKLAALETAKAQIDVIRGRISAQEAERNTASREAERYRKLAQTSAVSIARKEEAENRLNQAVANIRALNAELTATNSQVKLAEEEVKQTQVTAPIDGTILKIHTRQGERVGDNGVADIANLTQLDAVAEVYERDIARVKTGQEAEITIRGMDAPITGSVRELGFQVFKNDLNNTDPLANRDNRIIEVRITINAADVQLLRNMMYRQVDVRILP
ncbi:MAG: efflux RND transporter periplasmic adaptor subunit [Alphaproteobacteria bacterium]|nr:efflux RND transporter periplasmic adaptor subunit [Alphaproteobacteria bacterium]